MKEFGYLTPTEVKRDWKEYQKWERDLPSGQEVKAMRERLVSKMTRTNPYFALLNGEAVLRSNIELFAPFVHAALQVLIDEGRVVEQPMLFPVRPNDTMLFKA